jgi:3-hydroxymyristoyl/3-hydroxydecanoyl-(acyl carrier protein) dehydratase
VFSSGGLLDAEFAKNVAAALGAAPWEVLGSTETGGVAVRRRDRDGESWRPLPGVEVACEEGGERLVVRSPFVSVGEPSAGGLLRFCMGDRARLAADGSFLLLGRADRVAKVGEKRVSLGDMERDLETHACVDEAALAVLEQGSEPRVHAALVPSPEGRQALRRGGPRALRLELQRHLALRWDRVLLPRVWRFVEALPRNAQGKLPHAELEALFQRRREPLLSRETRGPGRLERRLSVPADLVYLDGHFDDLPVVPGVALLRWALDAAAELLGRRPHVVALEALKFPEPLAPGQSFSLAVEPPPAGDRVRFRLHDGERVFASGRAVLAPPPAERR